MTAPLSRRAVTSGLAWSVPAIAAATAAPSFAASFPCTRQIDDAFAAAQAYVRQNYLCDGQPVKRQLNFFQPAGVGDSVAQQVYVSVKHLSPCNVTFSPEYPLQLDIQVRNNTVLDDVGRSVTRFATSWGSGRVLSYPMNNKPVGSVNHDFDWAFSGTLPGAGLRDNEADLAMDFGDGLPIAAGTMVDSSRTGNHPTRLLADRSNGIF